MHLYHIYTRQTKPEDNQFFREYYVYARDELAARVKFHTRLPYAEIEDLFTVVSEESTLLLRP